MKTDEMHRHQLLEISPTDWPVLRDMFADIWPKHILGYSIVRNFIEWHEKNNDIRNLKLYSLDGDWQSDGTFLAIVSICRCFVKFLNLSRSAKVYVNRNPSNHDDVLQ